MQMTKSRNIHKKYFSYLYVVLYDNNYKNMFLAKKKAVINCISLKQDNGYQS